MTGVGGQRGWTATWTRKASFSPQVLPDVGKANNRGNAEKQKAIRHDLNRPCRVVPPGRREVGVGRTGGSGRWGKGAPKEFGASSTSSPGSGYRPFTLPRGPEAESKNQRIVGGLSPNSVRGMGGAAMPDV